MLNTTSLGVLAATLNVANISTFTGMMITTTATPVIATVTSTISLPTASTNSTSSILTSVGSLQTLPSKPIQNTQGDCRPQAPGYGPVPEEDNASSFYTSPLIRTPALEATTPPDYARAFRAANASYVGTNYLGYHELETYSPTECASKCRMWGASGMEFEPEVTSTTLFPDESGSSTIPTSTPTPRAQMCNSFNIYFERSPSINLGERCQDADSRTIIKCALWGEGNMRKDGATNTGYKNWDFEVVIAGSNGYVLGAEKQKEYEEDVKTSEGEKSAKLDMVAALMERFVVGAALPFLIAVVMGFRV
ncbi:hypothetical protein ACET3X_001366 [Alternaria dauci]|uniref:Uncharacterized protein n=1 Tax=Alternaria dauci TaxID=48095 RepID=A0ABR3UXF0_9PLEO